MALLKIARMGHPVLRARAQPIDDPAAAWVRQLVEDMIETMQDAGGTAGRENRQHIAGGERRSDQAGDREHAQLSQPREAREHQCRETADRPARALHLGTGRARQVDADGPVLR